ncbi:hypothetical protein BCON_0103g00340 [Botryotinia convoluta]|uniref:Uncharacterized protein n=1 Tax=Botryotinia convoluta TaxID=54673 RepID=A0A4Z1HZY8_9HELO|nr:hypothetical protein BCON_0103g00340 [Botryotinia convoluta]
MNPYHGEDLPLNLKSLSIIIHYDKSCSTDLRQAANSCQQDSSTLRNSHNSPTEKNHKQEAQLCEPTELTESAKKVLLTQAQIEVEQSKSKKIETADIHLPSKDTTTEQTEKLQQMIRGYIIHNPLQTHQQAVSVYKYFVAEELKKGTYPGGLPEQVKKRLQVRAQALWSFAP